jgi:hypothetical protein
MEHVEDIIIKKGQGILEEGTDKLYRNVSKKLPLFAE